MSHDAGFSDELNVQAAGIVVVYLSVSREMGGVCREEVGESLSSLSCPTPSGSS